jgi:hypothetical protein
MKLCPRDIKAAMNQLGVRNSHVPGLGSVFEFWLGGRLIGATWQTLVEAVDPKTAKKKTAGMSVQPQWGNGEGWWIPETNMTLAAASLIQAFLT